MSESLQIALDAVPAAIFLYRPDQILYANRAAAALIGCSQAELVGECSKDVFDGLPEAGSSNSSVGTLKTRGGTIAVTLTNAEIEFEGLPTRLITALKREQADESRLDNQRLFASVFESALVGIAIVNADGYYVQVNRTYAEIYGYSPEALIGQHYSLIFPFKQYSEAQSRHERFIQGEIPSVKTDWAGVRENGQPITISAFNNLYIAENGERFRIAIVLDVTEQKKTQQALQENEDILNGLMNSMGDAVWSVWAETYKLYYINPAIEALVGYSVEEFMSHEGLLFEIVHPEDRDYFLEQMRKAMNDERIDMDHRIVRRDGTIRWIHERFWLILTSEGKRIGGLMTDITDRKLAVELAVEQALHLKLENERVGILSNFVRDASHEFRTPLAVINMRLELMERTRDPEQHFKYIQRIKGQTDRILNLVEALILMSRLDQTTSLDLERVNLNLILSEMQHRMTTSAARNQLTCAYDLSAEPLPILGNINELAHAFNAVFENAVAFTLPGGLISVHSARLNDQEIAVEIRDTGIGIHPTHLPRIFERFYRADQAHSTQGFGLGLPITRKIVDLHHGHIEVESPDGKGSLFRLVFPADRPDGSESVSAMLT
ncbi:MAG: PAS domain S-box protein [Chloroflexota bacterium]